MTLNQTARRFSALVISMIFTMALPFGVSAGTDRGQKGPVDTAGSMKQEWRCDCWPWMGSGTQRSLAYSVEVSVPSGGSASWTLGMGGAF